MLYWLRHVAWWTPQHPPCSCYTHGRLAECRPFSRNFVFVAFPCGCGGVYNFHLNRANRVLFSPQILSPPSKSCSPHAQSQLYFWTMRLDLCWGGGGGFEVATTHVWMPHKNIRVRLCCLLKRMQLACTASVESLKHLRRQSEERVSPVKDTSLCHYMAVLHPIAICYVFRL